MKIKSFIAPNIENAMAQIRKEMGQSALILETRECEGGGFKGYLGKTLIEVIAAYPDDSTDDISENSLDEVSNGVPDTTVPESYVKNVAGNISQSRMLEILNERIKENHETKFADLINDAMLKPEKPSFDVMNKDPIGVDNLQSEIKKLKTYLLDQEIHERIVDSLLESSGNVKNQGIGTFGVDVLKDDIRKSIAGMIRTKKVIEDNETLPKRKIITFVGPTGVGKTTTLAKVAAKLTLENDKSVGVITIDTYRIAAVDQLRAYADMIDIPIRVAFTPNELSMAVEEFKGKEIILIDTVGRSQYNDKRIRMLRGLLNSLPNPENYLVMSAGTRNRDAVDIFTSFNILPIHGVVFTKIDETRTFGMLLNLVEETKMPICYITNGQEVPDDIVEADPEWVSNLIVCNAGKRNW